MLPGARIGLRAPGRVRRVVLRATVRCGRPRLPTYGEGPCARWGFLANGALALLGHAVLQGTGPHTIACAKSRTRVIPVGRWFVPGHFRCTSRLHLHFASVYSNPRAIVPNRCHGRSRLVGGSADRYVLQVSNGRRGRRGPDLWTRTRRHLRRVRADDVRGVSRAWMGSVDHNGGTGLFGAAFRNSGV